MSQKVELRLKIPELVFAGVLALIGVAIIVDAAGLNVGYSEADPVGPKTVPYVVAALLIASAVALAITVARGDVAKGDEGEDVDLDQPIDWRTILPLVGVFILNILLINVVGWVISGTILFFGSVIALGGRRYVLTLIISVLLALGTFYGFYLGLGIMLPAGILAGVL